jgi:hypothetical protein
MPAISHVTYEKLPDNLHHVRIGPIDWTTVKQLLAGHNEWIHDDKSSTEGSYTIIQSSNYDGVRYLNYYFSDQVTAFNFKIRWG